MARRKRGGRRRKGRDDGDGGDGRRRESARERGEKMREAEEYPVRFSDRLKQEQARLKEKMS